MSWSTNASAATVSTATVAIVVATNGTATASFSASAMDYAPGRYIYEVGTSTGTVKSVYRQGVLEILGSPYATGAGLAPWTTNGSASELSGCSSGAVPRPTNTWATGTRYLGSDDGTNYLWKAAP
jgi:hypothetical protein